MTRGVGANGRGQSDRDQAAMIGSFRIRSAAFPRRAPGREAPWTRRFWRPGGTEGSIDLGTTWPDDGTLRS